MIAKIIALAVVLLIGQSEAAMMESTTLNLGSRSYGFTSNIFLSQDKLTYLATKRTITIAVYGEENPPFCYEYYQRELSGYQCRLSAGDERGFKR